MTSTGPSDARPLQVRVADEIRSRIQRGDYPPGRKLPSFDELGGEFNASLAAVRKGIDLLKQQGLIVTVQGLGTFVRERPQARRHGIERYSRSRWSGQDAKPILTAEAAAQGVVAHQVIRELAEVPAPADVAERLGVPAGTTVWVRRRTTHLNDRPNQLADSYYPLDIVEGTLIREPDTGPGGGFARLEEAGYRLATVREEIAVRMPVGPESETLKLPEGTPVVELLRTVCDESERPVEVMTAIIAGDMATFDYHFPIPD